MVVITELNMDSEAEEEVALKDILSKPKISLMSAKDLKKSLRSIAAPQDTEHKKFVLFEACITRESLRDDIWL